MKRMTDPDFDVEPWASTLVDYCYFGGASPPPSMNTEPLEASARTCRQSGSQSPGSAKQRRPQQHRRQPLR